MRGVTLTTALGIVLLSSAAHGTEEHPQETGLKEIMQGLRDQTLLIADGLFTDDMEKVESGAAAIAHHAHIPKEQVQLIAAELGPEMPAFKQFDEQVHEASVSIVSAAKAQDRERLGVEFHRMVNGCLACHASYKERLASVLEKADQP